jgi:hypothetical protein
VALERTVAPEWHLPSVLGGHRVAPDVLADLVFTLGLMRAGGIETLTGRAVSEVIAEQLGRVDGDGTHTFGSYRVAETVARFGQFGDSIVLEPLDPDQRAAVATACDSTAWIPMLDGALPRNYAAVLARCELARSALGLDIDDTVVAELLERAHALMSANPGGWLDDSEDGLGHRYDMYTIDLVLFTEPFADRLGDCWERNLASAARLVDACVAATGAAIPWGRSNGVLGACHTIELAALLIARGTDRPERWLTVAAEAAHHLDGWFSDGLTTAHQHRSPFGYRGPARRLQLTLDALGKLTWAANRLEEATDVATVASRPSQQPEVDELIEFDSSSGVWAHRSRALAFSLPMVGAPRSDYLAAPRLPALFEVPVDRPLACWLPTVWSEGEAFAPIGPPDELDHSPRRLHAAWDRLGHTGANGSSIPMRRESTHRVDGRTLVIDERLDGAVDAEALAVTVPEAEGRPLRVEVASDHDHRLHTIDTDGIKEWRSFWGPLPRVHELQLAPAESLEWTMRVTPLIRLATESGHHHYHRSLYDPLVADVVEQRFHRHHLDRPDGGRSRLEHTDVFHLHWPEWFFGEDTSAVARFVQLLDDMRVRLVWTQHNLVPHVDGDFEPVYQAIAERADLVLHHSRWGMDRARRHYRYDEACLHRVVPHGHFGHLVGELPPTDRAATEAALGLSPCRIRLGVVGAPRRDKHTVAFAEAFARSAAPDVQLLVLSLADSDSLPEDDRITGLPYEFVDREEYDRRLATIDAVVLPFDEDGTMLTTGVVGDVVGSSLPAISSRWPYTVEVLGDAAIEYSTLDEVPDLVDALTVDRLARAAEASAELAPAMAFEAVSAELLVALDELGTLRL